MSSFEDTGAASDGYMRRLLEGDPLRLLSRFFGAGDPYMRDLQEESYFKDITFHLSCSSDTKITPDGLTGLVFYRYKKEKAWVINGVKMKTGYIILKNPKLLPEQRGTQHQTLFRWITGQEISEDFEVSGFSIKYESSGRGSLGYNSSTCNNAFQHEGWDSNRGMGNLESHFLSVALRYHLPLLGLKELKDDLVWSPSFPSIDGTHTIFSRQLSAQNVSLWLDEIGSPFSIPSFSTLDQSVSPLGKINKPEAPPAWLVGMDLKN